MINKDEILKAYCNIREINSTIPDDVLNFMKNVAIQKIEQVDNRTLEIKYDDKFRVTFNNDEIKYCTFSELKMGYPKSQSYAIKWELIRRK